MLGRIGQKAANLTRWVGEQVVGKDDFGRTVDDQRTRDYAVLGAATGAVAGAVIGATTGFNSQANNSIEEVWVDRSIKHPEMNGYSHIAVPDYDTECVQTDSETGSCTQTETTLEGWWHQYTPRISERVVGSYNEPTFQNTNTWEPLMGGALGAIGGGLLGMGAGLGIAALRRTLAGDAPSKPKTELKPEVEKALVNRAGIAGIAGAAIGVGVGAYVGSRAGTLELASQEVHARSWHIPVTETETLGHIPSSHYEYNWTGFPLPLGGNRPATNPVNRQVPVYDRSGKPRLTSTGKTFETNRYGPVFGGIVGGVVGAGVGVAAGVTFGVIDKMLTEADQGNNAA